MVCPCISLIEFLRSTYGKAIQYIILAVSIWESMNKSKNIGVLLDNDKTNEFLDYV